MNVNAPHLYELVDSGLLADAILTGLVKVRRTDDGQGIYNYTDAAVHTPGAGDYPAVLTCRGLTTEIAGAVVARPWATPTRCSPSGSDQA